MDNSEAKSRISKQVHSSNGIVGCLRPYRRVPDACFAELLEAMVAIHPAVVAGSVVERALVADLWSVCYRARGMALRSNSRVRRNSLESDDGLGRLADWIESVEKFSVEMFQGHELWLCLSRVVDLLGSAALDDPKEFRFMTPLLVEFQKSDDEDFAARAARAASAINRPSEDGSA